MPDETLDELFDKARGEKTELDVDGARVTREGAFGNVLIDGRPLSALPPSVVERVARGLRKTAGGSEDHLDPRKNPMIKLGDD